MSYECPNSISLLRSSRLTALEWLLLASILAGRFVDRPLSCHRSHACVSLRLSGLLCDLARFQSACVTGGVPTSSWLFAILSLSSRSSGKSILKVAELASGLGPLSFCMSSSAICWLMRSSSESWSSGGADGERDAAGYMFWMKFW